MIRLFEHVTPGSEPPEESWRPRATGARTVAAAVIVAVALASLAYEALHYSALPQTAALFVGIPALLTLVVIFFVEPRSAAGVAIKAVTVGLLGSMLFFHEGALCIAFSAPLFYAVALMIVAAWSRAVERGSGTTVRCLIVLAIAPLSIEGVTPWTTFNRDEWVTATRVVHVPAAEVGQAVHRVPRFDRSLPAFLRAGFPRPIASRIHSDHDGTRWTIRFRGGETRLNGTEPKAGDLTLQLDKAGPGFARWRALEDDSHMTHFLSWKESEVRWEALGPATTKVTWTLRYSRGLDPKWYFGPWQRYAARLAAGYLIDTVATP